MTKMIIIINGKGASGKDTLIQKLSDMNLFKIRNVSSIDPIKDALLKSGIWTGLKDEKSRKLLADCKVLFEDYDHVVTKHLHSQIAQFIESDEHVMFVHIREPEEITHFYDYVRTVPGIDLVYTVLVYTSRTTDIVFGNAADDEVFDYDYDLKINNDGIINDVADQFATHVQSLYCNCIDEKH